MKIISNTEATGKIKSCFPTATQRRILNVVYEAFDRSNDLVKSAGFEDHVAIRKICAKIVQKNGGLFGWLA